MADRRGVMASSTRPSAINDLRNPPARQGGGPRTQEFGDATVYPGGGHGFA
jgi:hypothetical protein